MRTLLDVHDLVVSYHTADGVVEAVRAVDLHVAAGEAVVIVGESGSGKSVTGRALLGLGDDSTECHGSIRLDGEELRGASEERWRSLRGTQVSMVFQDALDSLNPVYSVGSQLSEVLRVRGGLARRAAWRRACELLEQVGIHDAEGRMRDYPHQFSGGMRQRICIALAISLDPQILIADEPTTALDVTVQADILRLLARLRDELGMGLIFITHDLAVARLVASRVMVMLDGRVVETGDIDDVFGDPQHPYTRRLLAAHPGWVASWQELREASVEPVDAPRTMPHDQAEPSPRIEEVSHGR